MENALLDTSLESKNDGDKIIVRSIEEFFTGIDAWDRFPTHVALTETELLEARAKETLVVTGTNILSSNLREFRQWPLDSESIDAFENKVILLGVGWWQYQRRVKTATVKDLKKMVYEGIPASARDQYTADRLNSMGIPALNTACPTMWRLPDQIPPVGNNEECVFTLTDYNPHRRLDPQLVSLLASSYERLVIWPQGPGDQELLQRMPLPRNVVVAPRGLRSLDEHLQGRDYVGTRLHAGIRAAQMGCPTLVLAVDNRAMEIGRDTGFPVIPRDSGPRAVKAEFVATQPRNLRLPKQAINDWVELFEQSCGLGT